MAKAKQDDGSLKRLGGGRWQTRDARFSIEPQSGTWVVVDAEQTDELGLPLVRGPFGSLNAAKDAIAAAREAGPAVSPPASRLAQRPRPSKPTTRAAATSHAGQAEAGCRTQTRTRTKVVPGARAGRQTARPRAHRPTEAHRRTRPRRHRAARHRGQDPGGRRTRRQPGDRGARTGCLAGRGGPATGAWPGCRPGGPVAPGGRRGASDRTREPGPGLTREVSDF